MRSAGPSATTSNVANAAATTLPVVRIPDHVRTRRIGGGVVVLDLETEQYFGLDGIGADLWQLLRDDTPMHSAIDRLGQRYDVSQDVLVDDLAALVEVLISRGLLTRCGQPKGTP